MLCGGRPRFRDKENDIENRCEETDEYEPVRRNKAKVLNPQTASELTDHSSSKHKKLHDSCERKRKDCKILRRQLEAGKERVRSDIPFRNILQ